LPLTQKMSDARRGAIDPQAFGFGAVITFVDAVLEPSRDFRLDPADGTGAQRHTSWETATPLQLSDLLH
jgi:hypothetical protein